MKKRIIAILATFALFGIAVPATQAQAAYADCPSTGTKQFCIFGSASGSTSTGRADYAVTSTCQDAVATVPNMNNGGSSYVNRTTSYITLYDGLGCTGDFFEVQPSVTAGANFPASFDNKVSSMKIDGPNFLYSGSHQTAMSAGQYDGAQATFEVTVPTRATPTYHVLKEIAVQSDDGAQKVEIGLSIDFALHGDNNAHLFAYHWENDATTCYPGAGTSDCGFTDTAQANSANLRDTVALGKTVKLRIMHACTGGPPCNGAWWLWADLDAADATAGAYVGYYNDTNWTNLVPPVTFVDTGLVQWFGEVATKTHCPQQVMGKAFLPPSTSADLVVGQQLHDVATTSWVNGDPIITTADNPTYYNASRIDSFPQTAFRFGGPGSAAACKTGAPTGVDLTPPADRKNMKGSYALAG